MSLNGGIRAEAVGHVEEVEGTLVLKRIHVHFHVEADEEHRGTVDRVHGVFADRCPVYRSINSSIEVTTSYEVVDGEEEGGSETGGHRCRSSSG